MAIQNFLSGGYYGKLGDTVGQRWHNKRTIRTYVIPANPRTEKQQANRQMFAHATKLAQIAFQTNKGDPLWDTTHMGQFSQLVKTAMNRLIAGASDAEAIPLYPDGYHPSFVLDEVDQDWSSWPNQVTFTAKSQPLPQERTFQVMIGCGDQYLSQQVILTDEITVPAGSYFSYTFDQASRYALPAGSTLSAVTTDDVQHDGSSVSLPVLQLVEPFRPSCNIQLIFTHHNYDPVAKKMFIYAEWPLLSEGYEDTINVYVYNNWSEKWGSSSGDGIFINGNTTFVIWNDEDEYSFPTGCYIYPDTYAWDDLYCTVYLSYDRYDFSW